MTYLSSYWSLYVLQNTEKSLFLATFSFAPPPSHPVAVQGEASQMTGMIPQHSFRDDAST